MTIVRVIRNLAGMPFAWLADDATRHRSSAACMAALRTAGWRLQPVPARHRRIVRSRWLLPQRSGERPGSRLLHSPGRSPIAPWAVLINGVDHLVIQHARPGLCARAAAAAALGRAAGLERTLAFGRAPRWGWLAASPADCGAGLRVLWLIPAPGATGARDRLAAAGLVTAVGPDGMWQVTHRRPLGAAPARTLRRSEEALQSLPATTPPG